MGTSQLKFSQTATRSAGADFESREHAYAQREGRLVARNDRNLEKNGCRPEVLAVV